MLSKSNVETGNSSRRTPRGAPGLRCLHSRPSPHAPDVLHSIMGRPGAGIEPAVRRAERVVVVVVAAGRAEPSRDPQPRDVASEMVARLVRTNLLVQG